MHILSETAFEGIPGEAMALVGLVALCTFIVVYSRRAKPGT